jgi:hypothetical protein
MSRGSIVLIVSNGDDDHCGAVELELARRQMPVRRWDLATFPRASRFAIHLDHGKPDRVRGFLADAAGTLPLEQIGCVWLRVEMLDLFAPQGPVDDIEEFRRLELAAAFRNVTGVLRPAAWVNPPDAVRAMEPPIAQLNDAREAGLSVPHTLMTSDPETTRTFPDAIHRRGVTLFQEDAARDAHVTVFMAGANVFAAETLFIAAGTAETRAYRLPAAVEDACRRLMMKWGLVLASFQMVRRADEHLFLSCTANPQWLPIERVTGQPVTAAVADLLQGHGPAGDRQQARFS